MDRSSIALIESVGHTRFNVVLSESWAWSLWSDGMRINGPVVWFAKNWSKVLRKKFLSNPPCV